MCQSVTSPAMKVKSVQVPQTYFMCSLPDAQLIVQRRCGLMQILDMAMNVEHSKSGYNVYDEVYGEFSFDGVGEFIKIFDSSFDAKTYYKNYCVHELQWVAIMKE